MGEPLKLIVEGHTDYDSVIYDPNLADDRDSFEFTIILRIFLERLNPPKGKASFEAPDYSGTRWPAIRWNDAAWNQFRTRYLNLVNKVWDKAFILIPPTGYNGFVWPPQGGKRRRVLCRLDVEAQDNPAHAHAHVQVVRLANPDKSGFRSDSALYDSGDVLPKHRRWAPEGTTFVHNTPAHEVGHLLGLWHVGSGHEACVEQGDPACYGTNLTERMNVMGGGGMLDLDNALPWIQRIPWHTPPTHRKEWKADWASTEAALRGLEGMEIEESHKVQPAKPGLIDL